MKKSDPSARGPQTASLGKGLLVGTAATLLVGAAAVAALTYALTLEEMNEVFDQRLQQVALAVSASLSASVSPSVLTSVSASVLPSTPAAASVDPTRAAPAVAAADEDGEIDFVTQIWHPDGRLEYSTHPGAGPPFATAPGLSQVQSGGRGWHVMTVVGNGRIVRAAQPAEERSDLASDAALNLVAALLAVFAGVGAVIIFTLRRAGRALDQAAATIASRSARSLEPIGAAGLPSELAPLVTAVDSLMQRLANALAAQRRFVADAAHELRTPVTALRLQVQLLERAGRDDASAETSDAPSRGPNDDASDGASERKSRSAHARQAALAELHAGVARAQRLVEQLLVLSRAEPDAPLLRSRFDLGDLLRAVVAERLPAARLRGIDLRGLAQAVLPIDADRHQIEILLRNLVDNALLYGGAAGPVEVIGEALPGLLRLRVIDRGPGIAPDDRVRVFDRFWRGSLDAGGEEIQGSGLGLSIVRAVAQRHGATVSIHDGPQGSGVELRVEFPADS